MELRKCECGGDARSFFLGMGGIFTVECLECGSQTKDVHDTRELAIQAWNEGKVE